MRVYISGPITGKSREEVETTFFGVEMELRDKGHEVINPAKIEHWKLPWEDYMLIAEIILRRGNIDQIYVLRGYEKSKGSLIEIGWAKLLGIPVVYQETGGRDESDIIYCDRNYCYRYDSCENCPVHVDPNGAMNKKYKK